MIPAKYNLSNTIVLNDKDKAASENNAPATPAESQLNNFGEYSTVSLQEIMGKYNLVDYADKTVEQVQQENDAKRDYTALMQVKEVLPTENDTTATMPNEQQEQQVAQQNTLIRNKNVQPALNFRGKLIVMVYACVMVFLGALMISNAVTINDISTNIEVLNQSIATENVNLTDIKKAYDLLNKADNLTDRATDANMSAVSSSEMISLLPIFENTASSYTNWFDALCNYITRVLGG